MPMHPEQVTVNDLLDALHNLGSPAVFAHPDRDVPDNDKDFASLVGGAICSVERLIVDKQLNTDEHIDDVIGGWLARVNAQTDPIGVLTLVGIRAAMTSRILAEFTSAGDMYDAMRGAAEATGLLVTASVMVGMFKHGVEVGDADADMKNLLAHALVHLKKSVEALELMREQMRDAGLDGF